MATASGLAGIAGLRIGKGKFESECPSCGVNLRMRFKATVYYKGYSDDEWQECICANESCDTTCFH